MAANARTAAAEAAPQASLAEALDALAPRLGEGATGIEDLQRLSGGASQETWAFRLAGPGTPLILRRAPDAERPGARGVGLPVEAAAIRRAEAEGVPVPPILHELRPEDGAGQGFVMPRIEGETLAPRILRKPEFAPAREGFARQAGQILAAIHRIDPEGLPLKSLTPWEALDDLADRHRDHGQPRPVFDLAIRWLGDHVPDPVPPRLVHGDFRMGNLMIGPARIEAVLDWELVHLGDPASDLAWLCMPSWRFGGDKPVGGVGEREDLIAAYEAAGGAPIDRAALRWWEVLSALRWGVMIEEMGAWVRSGADRSVERHVIAHRASEIELILMLHLTGRAD